MKVLHDIPLARKAINSIVCPGKSVGLVPTMGTLHEGHISLITASNKENNVTVASIFVNPTQFNNHDDFKNYPSTFDEDLSILEKNGCDIVFAPTAEGMYPKNPVIKLSFGKLGSTMEGAFRPGHFSGVALVVLKLFNLLKPTRAYFGQKDLQQFKIIEQIVADASLDIDLKMMPTVREGSGLALSSRNKRLSEKDRSIAIYIIKALNLAADAIKNNTDPTGSIVVAKDYLQQFPDIKVEYLTLVNLKDLQVVESAIGNDQLVLCFAGYIDNIRLIDNLIIN